MLHIYLCGLFYISPWYLCAVCVISVARVRALKSWGHALCLGSTSLRSINNTKSMHLNVFILYVCTPSCWYTCCSDELWLS